MASIGRSPYSILRILQTSGRSSRAALAQRCVLAGCCEGARKKREKGGWAGAAQVVCLLRDELRDAVSERDDRLEEDQVLHVADGQLRCGDRAEGQRRRER